MARILIIEDEESIREELEILLRNAGYDVICTENFSTVEWDVRNNPDLILLDINLQEYNGFSICTAIRKSSKVPIIFITGRSSSIDELQAFTSGGDDYITKPYHPTVLLARISAVLKRTKGEDRGGEQTLVHKGLTLDQRSYKLVYRGNSQELSKNEFKLLHYLFQRKGEVVPRLDIIEYLWDNDVFIDDNTLSVNVTRIRSKLEQLGVTDFIGTKRGVGYII
ncbi:MULTISPECIES: response regulator transcription factor [Paenibacillus]|uniref:response regulator transcription factor n=1 Tax=Paenibacillus TaxID=44249 RepID=UPI000837D99A|nr:MULTISPECIES: response regulator transcription factor [Paenibacillus]GIP22180.1 DNA-binding response regulator [Paenibacillus sp. J22TS3]